MPRYKVFISHAGTDTWVATQIAAHVSKHADTFLDEANVDFGDDFEAIILAQLRDSQEMVVLLTPWALHRPYIWLEIGAAWGQRKRIVGVLYGVAVDDINKLEHGPVLLKRLNLVEINDIDRYFEQLAARIARNGVGGTE